ncbi:methyltransferase domain-containing protein [Thiotrichales bacterium 19S3-7]|nr:methyltransferase domain-containing protein [Thiotrichales bacterium 19S3-7]MCF6802714.1 methyltransferase domain-containing protein [Thiotrichales bacterium 19S3-11]
MQQVSLSQIKQSFNRAAITYSDHNLIQQLAQEHLVEQIVIRRNNFRIAADFACGIGLSTKYIMDQFRIDECYAIDIADCALKLAHEHLKHYKVKLIESDYHQAVLKDNSLDLAFCNMGFQWSYDLMVTLKVMYQQLANNGILAFSLPLSGTFSYLNACDRLNFLTSERVLTMLKLVGFSVVSFEQFYKTYNFQSSLEALKVLKGIGANINHNLSSSGLITLNQLDNFFKYENQYALDYRIGLFVAQK